MARSKFLQRILDETPDHVKVKVRKYADTLIRNNKKNIAPCKECRCADLEEWLKCQDSK